MKDKRAVGGPPDVLAERRKAGLGCFLAFVLPPLVGVVTWRLSDLGWGLVAAAVTFLVAMVWSAWVFAGTVGRDDFEPQWSFTPMSSILIAATDVFSTVGDVAALPTAGLGYLLVVAVALATSALVLFIELLESGRFLYSLSKALVALVLILIPTPVGGLVGAGASLGHRLLGAGRRHEGREIGR